MADARTFPAKQKSVMIKLYPADLCEVMFQAAQEPEVLATLQPHQLDRILFELNTEHQTRNSKGENDEPK